MIIVIRSSATREERTQLMTLLYRVGGSQRPIATLRIDEQEVIALEGSILDAQAHSDEPAERGGAHRVHQDTLQARQQGVQGTG